MRKFVSIGLLFMIIAALAACSGLAGEPEIVATLPPPDPAQANQVPDLELGAQIYAERCTDCHGITGAGDGPELVGMDVQPPDFTDPATTANRTLEEYTQIVRNGRLEMLMPPFGGSLSVHEQRSVAAYVFTLADEAAETVDTEPVTTEEAAASTEAPAESTEIAAESTEAPADTTTALGSISGQLLNQSGDGTPPAGVAVELHIIDANFNEEVIETTTDASGVFRFEDIEIRQDRAYMVTTSYNEAFFRSDMYFSDGSEQDVTLDIPVYDSTDDPSVLQISSVLTQVNYVDERVQIIQRIHFVNTSDRLFRTVDENGNVRSVQINLPQGALVSEGTDIERYRIAPDGTMLSDTQPVPPNTEHVVLVAYTLFENLPAEITQSFNYPINGRFEVYVDDATLRFSGTNMVSIGQAQAETTTFEGYGTLIDLPVGEAITYTVRAAPPNLFDQRTLAYVLMIVGVAVLAFGAGLFLRLNFGGGQKTEAPAAPNAPVSAPQPSTREQLIAQIAALDAQYEEGQLSEKAYNNRRQQLKEQLSRLMKS